MRKSRSKSALFLIELVLVTLLLSISAAICMSIFAQAKQISEQSRDLTGALIRVQSAAAVYKASDGDLSEAARILGAEFNGSDTVTVNYDENWTRAQELVRYIIVITKVEANRALIEAREAGAESPIYELSVRVPRGAEDE